MLKQIDHFIFKQNKIKGCIVLELINNFSSSDVWKIKLRKVKKWNKNR